MGQVYSMSEDSSTTRLQRVACSDEDKELQRLLEQNLDLLPGDQINTEESLRWMLIKREMPVVNPASGAILWSADFLLTDQYAVPTLVECKRRNDSRSPRETVGQMLEYAASGNHYWSASDLRSYAQDSAEGEESLAVKLRELTGAETDPEEFFLLMKENLKKSRMRLIFFVDDSRMELRNMVEFLNGQMKDLEMLIVEARQYQQGSARIVVPWVFGFTEEARVAKQESKAETLRASGPSGEAAFWDAMRSDAASKEHEEGVRSFIDEMAKISGCEVDWKKSCIIRFPQIVPNRTLLTINREAALQLYLFNWVASENSQLSEKQVVARDRLFNGLSALFEMNHIDPEVNQYPYVSPRKWLPKADAFLSLIRKVVEG